MEVWSVERLCEKNVVRLEAKGTSNMLLIRMGGGPSEGKDWNVGKVSTEVFETLVLEAFHP